MTIKEFKALKEAVKASITSIEDHRGLLYFIIGYIGESGLKISSAQLYILAQLLSDKDNE